MEIYLVLQRLVSMPSVDDEMTVQLYLKGLLAQFGFAVDLIEVLPGRANLWASRGKGGPLIVAHADTFPQGDHPDPFHLRDLDGRLAGRGAVDAKGQIAALVKALSLNARPCSVLITVDEERDGKGSEAPFPAVEGALVLEPTRLGIAVAQAGFLESAITVRGQSAHGATPAAGVNAILRAFDLYNRFNELSFLKTSHDLFPAPWFNLQSIKGGNERTVVPSSCTFEVDFAILPGVELEAATNELASFLHAGGATHELIDSSPPFEIDPTAEVVSTLSAAFTQTTDAAPQLVGMPSWTDAANLIKKGIPTVIFGAGDLSTAHSDREEVDTVELETLARVLAAFIDFWQV